MKMRTTALISALMIFFCIRSGAQGLVAHYDFNNRLTDQSSFGNHGRLVGNLQMIPDRFGRPCGALYLDGSTYVEIPTSPSLESPTNALTIAVWFQLPRVQGQQRWVTIACKGTQSQESLSSPQYRLQIQQNFQNMLSVCSPTLEAPSSTISMSTDFTRCDPAFLSYGFQPMTWTFFVLVYDGVSVKCYTQGRKVFEEPYSEKLMGNSAPLTIGMDAPGQQEFYTGALDDLKIYDRALTDIEVGDLFQLEDKGASDNIEIENIPNMLALAHGGSCGTVIDFPLPRANSECSGSVMVRQVLGPKSGSLFPVGRTRIEFEAISATGKSVRSGFFINVKDVTPPALEIPGDQTIEIPYGDSAFTMPMTNPKASDPCGIRGIVQKEGPIGNQLLKPGVYLQSFEAIDINGNRSVRSRKLTIVRLAPQPPIVATVIKVDVPKPSTVGSVSVDSSKKHVTTTPIPSHQQQISVSSDTMMTKRRMQDFKSRIIEVSRQIEVESDSITVYLYDNGIIDDDTVSLYYNESLLLDRKRISDVPYKIRFEVDSLKDNLISLFAENLGSIPPNTAYLVLVDGANQQEFELSSNENQNGSLLIRRRKKH
jgi:hypothetical protein